MKKNKITILVLSLIAVSLVGCTATDKNTKNMSLQTRLNNNTNDNGYKNSNNNGNLNTNLSDGMTRNNMETNDMLGMKDSNTNMNMNMNMDNNSMSTRAMNISNKIKNLPEVSDASVVINGDTALVGYKLKNTNSTQTNTDLKKKIETAVKTVDNNIKTVTTTADTDLYDRITTMSKDLETNPISNFAKDIEDLLNKMMSPKR